MSCSTHCCAAKSDRETVGILNLIVNYLFGSIVKCNDYIYSSWFISSPESDQQTVADNNALR